jgi:hypothetical protein
MYEPRTDVNSIDKEPVVWYLVNEKKMCPVPEGRTGSQATQQQADKVGVKDCISH